MISVHTRQMILYPNPTFSGLSCVEVKTERAATVSLKVYNLLGMEVKEVVKDVFLHAGWYHWEIEGLKKGIYIVKFESEELNTSKTLVVLD